MPMFGDNICKTIEIIKSMLSFESTDFDTIVPLSGGIDSTAAMYWCLNQFPEKKFLAFRIDMVHGTSGHRTTQEARATEKILSWFGNNGFTNFGFRELRIDYSSLGMTPPVWDSEVVNFAASLIIQAKPSINRFIEGAIKNDFEDAGFEQRLKKIEQILRIHTQKSPTELTIEFPLKDKNKYEVMKSIPQELLELTWSCRYPKIVAPWTFGRCHDCPQCKIIDTVLDEHANEFPDKF
jgi:7-cyano-7-deazaguanine synthase in queuosine biosynthesis